MINSILTRIVGTKNERELKRIRPVVAQIGVFEPALRELSDHALARRTVEFRERLAKGASLDDLLPEAFAVVREAGRRVLNMRHFDVQLIGGMVLHRGMIAEMKTGEGKTLVATLAAYLNALPAKGVHVVHFKGKRSFTVDTAIEPDNRPWNIARRPDPYVYKAKDAPPPVSSGVSDLPADPAPSPGPD
jgi:hypothetical protein